MFWGLQMNFSKKFNFIFIYGCLLFGGLLSFSLFYISYLNGENLRIDVTIFRTILCLLGGCAWGWVMYKWKFKK